MRLLGSFFIEPRAIAEGQKIHFGVGKIQNVSINQNPKRKTSNKKKELYIPRIEYLLPPKLPWGT